MCGYNKSNGKQIKNSSNMELDLTFPLQQVYMPTIMMGAKIAEMNKA